jgi:inner membrane protein
MRGLAIAAMISVLYGLLYVILLSEDYALLLGSLLLFGTLATVMVMTRRVDGYRLGETARAEPGRSTPMP